MRQAEAFRLNGVVYRKRLQEKLYLGTRRLDFHYDFSGSEEALD